MYELSFVNLMTQTLPSMYVYVYIYFWIEYNRYFIEGYTVSGIEKMILDIPVLAEVHSQLTQLKDIDDLLLYIKKAFNAHTRASMLTLSKSKRSNIKICEVLSKLAKETNVWYNSFNANICKWMRIEKYTIGLECIQIA